MTPVSSKAQAILDAAVEAQAVAPDRMSANLSALESRLAAGDLGPELGPETMPPSPAPAPSASAIGTGAKVVGALLLVGALGLALRPSDQPAPTRTASPAVVAPGVTAPVAEAPTPEPVPEPAPVAIEAPEADDATEAKPSASVEIRTKSQSKSDTSKRPKVISAEDSSIDRLEEEMALMSEARRALGRGDARKALELLNKHGREFPTGEFRRERVVSRVTALCALGQKDAARRVAKRYLAKDSSSVHAQRISQTCAGGE